MVVIVNYGLGNLRSVEKAFLRIGIPQVMISSDPEKISEATHLVLPGVGHFGKGMQNLKSRGLIDVLNEQVLERGKPILGICLGMQLMTSYSDESNENGLNWIRAQTKAFRNVLNEGLKIPHMGWNDLKAQERCELPFTSEGNRFYFVHSYYVDCEDENDIETKTTYGIDFVSSFRKNNIVGLQFHPEKSHDQGLALLKYFHQI